MQQHVGFQLLAFIALSTIILPAQAPAQHAQTKLLDCPQGDCELLRGAPETSGMRSGFVRLHPGEAVGWHTTGKNEEELVIPHGKGEAQIDGQPSMSLAAPAVAYIPKNTRHNVQNTGSDTLEYVYVVAPTTGRSRNT